MSDEYNPDPPDSPLIRHVLYSNDVVRLMASFVQGLLTVARPERVRRALEAVLESFDEHVKMAKDMAAAVEKEIGEPSGWREPNEEN